MIGIDDIAGKLADVGIENPRREARAIIIAVTGIDPYLSENWLLHADAIEVVLTQRMARLPLSKIVGRREFYGREFIVSEDVLDPRPDSELIIDEALKLSLEKKTRILDLGTGSGCLILTMLAEMPDALGVAVDISPKALTVATRNADVLDVKNRCTLVEQDLALYTPEVHFDLLISNPPYIKSADIEGLEPEVRLYDPMLALDGGADGCDPYRVIFDRLHVLLRPGCYFLLEMAPDICENVRLLAIKAGCEDVEIVHDLAGRERVLKGRCG